MKKSILPFTLLAIAAVTAKAQTVTETTSGTITRTSASGVVTRTFQTRSTIDSTTIVKDSTGVRLKYADWHDKVLTGEYALRTMNKPTDSIRIFTLTKTDAATRERMRAYMPPVDETGIVHTGAKLNLYRIKDINGDYVEPKDLHGKIVVLNFWFINCVPCRTEMPALNKIKETYANNPDVVFIAIALDDKDDVTDFLKKNPFNYRMVPNGRNFADLSGINSYPTNVVLDKEGKVVFHATGYFPSEPDHIDKAIRDSK